MENEDFLWAAVPFMGGIAGQQAAPCGAVSAATVFLGLKHRCSIADEERAKDAREKSRSEASEFIRRFTGEFGDITCGNLLGIDLSIPSEAKRFRESGISKEKCDRFVPYTIDLLYEFGRRKPGRQKTVRPANK